MKRLKYRHLFNGRQYPLYLGCIAACVAPLITLAARIELNPVLVMPCAFLLVLVICFLIEHRLSREERQLIADAPMPLWKPVNAPVRSKIREKYESSQFRLPGMIIGSLVIGIAVFVIGILPTRHSTGFNDPSVVLPIAAAAAIIGFIVMLLCRGRGAHWLEIDESAMYTVIPVHHCYEIKQHHRSPYRLTGGETWYENYLVFYQPDGRYVLKIPKGGHFCSAVIIVLYHGAVTWLPVDAYTPEDTL